MKDIVRCTDCSICAIEQEYGFTGGEVLHCTCRDEEVEPNDGCTLGSLGDPMRWIPAEQVSIDGYAAVCGDHAW